MLGSSGTEEETHTIRLRDMSTEKGLISKLKLSGATNTADMESTFGIITTMIITRITTIRMVHPIMAAIMDIMVMDTVHKQQQQPRISTSNLEPFSSDSNVKLDDEKLDK